MLGKVGNLLEARCSPEKEAPLEQWDWIRIDDLPNRPWQVENVRTQLGKEINGTFFEVQENDILLARLGPAIQNAKFVICPKLTRRTVASSEFSGLFGVIRESDTYDRFRAEVSRAPIQQENDAVLLAGLKARSY